MISQSSLLQTKQSQLPQYLLIRDTPDPSSSLQPSSESSPEAPCIPHTKEPWPGHSTPDVASSEQSRGAGSLSLTRWPHCHALPDAAQGAIGHGQPNLPVHSHYSHFLSLPMRVLCRDSVSRLDIQTSTALPPSVLSVHHRSLSEWLSMICFWWICLTAPDKPIFKCLKKTFRIFLASFRDGWGDRETCFVFSLVGEFALVVLFTSTRWHNASIL